ncbi:MAG: hypothetical protein EBW68_03765 [Actinobacteria bacterium]|nr:hypothetical protein [Actinomycetota bacterium]
MPRRKPKPEKVIQEKIKENLDAIIMEESLDSISLDSGDLPRLKTSELMNFADEKLSALTEARFLMDSVAKFYVDPDAHGHVEFLDVKKKVDAMNVSSMMFQMKSAQHAITKLLEEIDLGNMHPRIFEVLAQLQSQIMQMPKDYQAYLEKMEQSYKRVNTELEVKKHSGGVVMDQNQTGEGNSFYPSNTDGAGIRSRGTRGIMEGLRDILGNEVIDVKPIELDPNSVVNAREKKLIDDKFRPQDDEEDQSDFIIEDDIIE